jgi:hypothetical protein
MRKVVLCVLLVSILLTGCSGWRDGYYVSVTPHTDDVYEQLKEMVEVESYAQIQDVLIQTVESGSPSVVLSVEKLDEELLDMQMEMAISYVTGVNPYGAYAVDSILYEMGSGGTVPAVAVVINYNYRLPQLRAIHTVENMAEAVGIITSEVDRLESGVILRVKDYHKIDYVQMLQDYADQYPELVMEIPQITASTYPYEGSDCILEIQITYQSNRESLRNMQARVQDVFSSARLYVSGDGEDQEKYNQLYSFLMERYEYQFDTSITPAYSLLCHGVGDYRTFATIYAAMCRRSGLECYVVTGTKNAEPWFWNIVCIDGMYYHADLLSSDNLQLLGDSEMDGYVWAYSAYPACGSISQLIEETPEETVAG